MQIGVRYRIRKKFFRLWGLKLAILLILITGVILIFDFAIESKKLTGNEWLNEQYSYMNNVAFFCEEMDTVYSLYLSGNMSRTDFLAQYKLLVKQHELMEADYDIWLKEHPVKTGSFSYISKKGENAINGLRKNISLLLLETVPDGIPQDIKTMTYTYLQYNDAIENNLIEYAVAFRWLVEADTADTSMKRVLNNWNNYVEAQTESN